MTTPRVTVPVERAEYERLISVTEDLIREVSDPGTEALAAVYCAKRILDQSAMLSAAPAPDGAVTGRTFKDQRAQKAYDLFLREGWMRGDIERFYRSGFAGVARPDETNTPRIAVWLAGRDRAKAGLPHGIPDRPEFRNLIVALAAPTEAATGAQAVIRNGQIVISIDVDALPLILSGSIALNAVAGTFKVTDAATFAKEVCHSLNAEKEDGTTRVHMMFDSAFNHAIDQGAEGVEEISEDEFEAEAARLQAEAKGG